VNLHKLALIFSHPTQFEAPLFRKLAKNSEPPIKVFFWNTDRSSELIDPELGHAPEFDIPLNAGYEYEMIPKSGSWNFLRNSIFQNPEFSAVLVNGYSGHVAHSAILQGMIFGKPVVIRSDTTSLYPRPFWKQLIRKPALFILLSLASAAMATGSLAAQHLITNGASPESVFLLPYSVDEEMLSESCATFAKERCTLRADLELQQSDVVLLAVVKLIEREGILDLLEAYSAISPGRPELKLLIVGDGPLRESVTKFVQSRKLSGVRFAGYQPYSRLPMYYAVSDLFIHPAVNEPWGVSVNEAMCCGLPVIVSDLTGSSYDLVQNGKNGYVYPGGNTTELQRALENFLSKYNLRVQMGIASRTIVKNWGYELCISEIRRMLAFVDQKS
jgi:hypothetical protein